MSNPTTSRFERHSRELGDLVDILAEGGIVWGRHFGLVGYPEPDAFELTEALAVRASVLWTAHTMPAMPPVKKSRSKRNGSTRKASKPAGKSSSSTARQGTAP